MSGSYYNVYKANLKRLKRRQQANESLSIFSFHFPFLLSFLSFVFYLLVSKAKKTEPFYRDGFKVQKRKT